MIDHWKIEFEGTLTVDLNTLRISRLRLGKAISEEERKIIWMNRQYESENLTFNVALSSRI